MKSLESRIKKIENKKRESLKFIDKGYGIEYNGKIYFSKDELINSTPLEDEDVTWINEGILSFYNDIENENLEDFNKHYEEKLWGKNKHI